MNPTQTNAWNKLSALATDATQTHLIERFNSDSNRFSSHSIQTEYLLYDYSKNHVDQTILNTLLEFAGNMNFKNWRDQFLNGQAINETENRAVMHTALRNFSSGTVEIEGKDVLPDVQQVLAQIKRFCDLVISGAHKGFSGKSIKHVVNIGIGGSDLGPKMAYQALNNFHNHLNVHFVSNVDGAAIQQVLKKVDLESTLFIVVSKTFTTIETLTNANSARQAVLDLYKDDQAVANHFAAVSTNLEGTANFGIDSNNVFEFWNWVGGRYSMWSAVGLSLALGLGYEHFSNMLRGAHAADLHFKNAEDRENIPLLMALIGIWNTNFLDMDSQAVIPYSENLGLFSKFLQQLDMESNGKSVDKQGHPVNYKTSTVIWGEPGTDSQHSFFQLLHQGTPTIPVDFIAFRKESPTTHDRILLSNLIGQARALMCGTYGEDMDQSDPHAPHKEFTGNRPSSMFILKNEDPFHLGYLTAFYEHKVFCQGILWNVFSFDQWGVQLGKKLATELLHLDEAGLEKLDSSSKALYQRLMK